MAPKEEGSVDKVGVKGMIIPEFLTPGLGTDTRSELDSLLTIPFFFWFFYGLSLSCPQTLLSLSFAPLLAKGWDIDPMGKGAVYKGGGKGMRILL